jgi:endonuclease IV
MLPQYLDKNIASKYIYQIHFSDVKNNDGYIKKETHGRKHDDLEGMRKDYKILVDYNLTNKNIIPEIAEENYKDRKDQLYEIKLLKEAEKNKLL